MFTNTSFSFVRLSASKIVSLILNKDIKIDAHGKESTDNAGDLRDTGLIPGLERSPGGGHGNPLWYSCWGNPMDRGGWQTAVQGSHRVRHDWSNLAQLVDRAIFRQRDSWWRSTLWHSLSPSICSLLSWWVIPKWFSPQGRYCVSSDYAHKMDPKQMP